MSVNWNKAGNVFLIESTNHLVALMNKIRNGTGDIPVFAGGEAFRQTVDIDLAGVAAFSLNPIFGVDDSTAFSGSYDGDGYTISNWTYTKNNRSYVGLFGYCKTSVTIRNVRLRGVWSVRTNSPHIGFLVGGCNLNTNIYNCDAIFDEGTLIDASSTSSVVGCMIGDAERDNTIAGVSVGGTINIVRNSSVKMGGVIGSITDGVFQVARNTATFTGVGLSATSSVGGVIAEALNSSISRVMNAMVGDISAALTSTSCGGVVGRASFKTGGGLFSAVNSMVGNITVGTCGGVAGSVTIGDSVRANISSLANYMTGDITSDRVSAGLVGSTIYNDIGNQNTVTADLQRSVVAMNGSVSHAVSPNYTTYTAGAQASVDTTFGMTFTETNPWPPSDTALNGETHPDFPDLEYLDFAFTDDVGNEYNWDFVFGNLAGKPAYSSYTHASVHKGDVSAPFRTTFDLPSDNSTAYLTYANLNAGEVFLTDGTLTVVDSAAVRVLTLDGTVVFPPPPMQLTPRAINVLVDIAVVVGAVAYRVTHQSAGTREILVAPQDASVQRNARSLEPETEYTFRLYVDTGAGFELIDTQAVTTLEDITDAYVATDFLEGGVFRLDDFSPAARGNISSRLSSLFTTGDALKISTRDRQNLDARFVNRGDTTTTDAALLVPFDEESGAAQAVTLSLSDGVTSVAVNYDETSNTIGVESSVYAPGDSFVVDDKKCTVLDYED
ncbi:unnamed protein product [Pylaiella littoralis]